MTRKIVDVAVIIPDASPVLTLARVGRIDLLGTFAVPIKIVDQVHDEITRPENDPRGECRRGVSGAARAWRRPVEPQSRGDCG